MKKADKIKQCQSNIKSILNNNSADSYDVELAFALVGGILAMTGNSETADLLNQLVKKHVKGVNHV